MSPVGHPDRRELAGARELGQRHMYGPAVRRKRLRHVIRTMTNAMAAMAMIVPIRFHLSRIMLDRCGTSVGLWRVFLPIWRSVDVPVGCNTRRCYVGNSRQLIISHDGFYPRRICYQRP